LLSGEFENIYNSLFEAADNHLKTVKTLAAAPKALRRGAIIEQCELSSGGNTTIMLDELEQSGFMRSSKINNKETKDAIYRLIDEFSLFYLKFMFLTLITIYGIKENSQAANLVKKSLTMDVLFG
jgi:uncharacterized protein